MNLWGLDSETFLMFPGYMAPECVCNSWAHGDRFGVMHRSDPQLVPFLRGRFEQDRTVFAHCAFDLAVYMNKDSSLAKPIFDALDDGRVHDVLMREKLFDLARGTFRFEEDEEGKIKAKGYSLAEVCMRRLGYRLPKDGWRMKYHDLYDVPVSFWPREAYDYSSKDAVVPVEVFNTQEELRQSQLKNGLDLLGNETAQNQASMALQLMTCWGFKTDPEAVANLKERVTRDIEQIQDGLVATGLVRQDGTRDTKAAVRRMVSIMGPQSILTKKGLEIVRDSDMSYEEVVRMGESEGRYISVAEEPCIMTGDATLRQYSRYTKLRNLLTGSVKHLEMGTVVPIQSRFETLMETGRTSSSNPNIQNLRTAPGVRECFVPREGCVLIACDFSAAELHTLAQVCYDLFGRSNLGDMLNKGIDPHCKVASSLINEPYEAVLRAHKNNEDWVYKPRQLAKAADFGFPGGCSARRFVGIAHSYKVDIDISTAARTRAVWFQELDEMRDYFDYVGSCVDKDGWHWVKQNRVDRFRGRCTFTSACNSYFQGLCADGAKSALYEVTKEQFTDPSSSLYNTRCVAFVHDEIIIECPEHQAHDAALRLQAVMEKAFNVFVPDCPTTAEPTIMRYWSKKAKPVWTHDGKLIPWEGEMRP